MSRAKRTPQSIASELGSWVLSGIRVIGWLVLAAGVLTGAALAIQALIVVYRMGATALGVESHG